MNPGLHGAIAAAEARRRKQQEEEEEERMTRYNGAELEGDWEFKIIRANTPVFRKPETLQRILQEEAVAGWVMLEKLDDNRIRLKRPESAKRRDSMLPAGVNPYRTQVGGQAPAMILTIAGLTMALVLGMLIFVLAERDASFSLDGSWMIIGALGFFMVIFIALVALKARR